MTGADPTLQQVISLEARLLDAAIRRDAAEASSLLHPDFREIGVSGRWWTRDEVVAALDDGPDEQHVAQSLDARRVGDDAVLVTYASRDSLRSSLWVRSADGWCVLFHQGTPIA